jgi:hypothetical protein
MTVVAHPVAPSGKPLEKGLKTGALGFISSVVIGVASTAPGYSLAASLGLVTAAVAFQAPAVFVLAFLPMLFGAAGNYNLNKTDPDCGTTFSWATRAFGPWAGWLGGWDHRRRHRRHGESLRHRGPLLVLARRRGRAGRRQMVAATGRALRVRCAPRGTG